MVSQVIIIVKGYVFMAIFIGYESIEHLSDEDDLNSSKFP